MNKDFVVGDCTISMKNSVNPYSGNCFSFCIFDKDGKCVLMGDDGEHKELNQELAERIYQIYLNHQDFVKKRIKEGKLEPLSERMKKVDPNSPLMQLMQKRYKQRLER